MNEGIGFLAFGLRDEGLVWIRASGALDAVEWDRVTQGPIEGTNRDGGFPMPEGHWETARLPGATRRLVRVEVEREGFAPLGLVAFTERVAGGAAASVPGGRRWTRFAPTQQGATHRLRVRAPETLAGVATIDMVFSRADGPGR